MKKVLVILMGLCISIGIYAQSTLRQGVVYSQTDGEPLIGVGVMIKNTSKGTLTDIDGRFSIEAESTDVLVLSYIGFETQEVVVGNETKFSISLREKAELLDELVVIGYGVQKKSVVTASISKVTADELNATKPSRIEDALKGKVSGVQITQSSGQPGSDSKVRIRGIGTVNNSEPLYIVDGMAVTGGIKGCRIGGNLWSKSRKRSYPCYNKKWSIGQSDNQL